MRLFIQIILSCFLFNCILCKPSCLQEIRPSIRFTLRNPYDFPVKFNIKNSVFSHLIPPTKFITLVNDDDQTREVLRTLEWVLFGRKQNDDSFLILPAFAEHSIDIDISTFFDLSSPGNYSIYIKNGENTDAKTSEDLDSSLYLESMLEENYLSITEFTDNRQAFIAPTKQSLRKIREAKIPKTNSSSSLTFHVGKNYQFCATRWTYLRNCLLFDECRIQHAKLSPDDIYARQEEKKTKTSSGRKEEAPKGEGRFLFTKDLHFLKNPASLGLSKWGAEWPGYQRSLVKRATQLMWNRLNNLLLQSGEEPFDHAMHWLFRKASKTTVIDKLTELQKQFRNKPEVYYYAYTLFSAIAYTTYDGTAAHIHWNIAEISDYLDASGILGISNALLHELLHYYLRTIDAKDQRRGRTNEDCYHRECCKNLPTELALQNSANYEFIFTEGMWTSLKINNYKGHPCGLVRDPLDNVNDLDIKFLMCIPLTQGDEFECNLYTEDDATFQCRGLRLKGTDDYVNAYGYTTSKTTIPLQLKKQEHGGWVISHFFKGVAWHFPEPNPTFSVMSINVEEATFRSQFELFFEGIDSMRRFYLAPKYILGDWQGSFVDFTTKIGTPGRVSTSETYKTETSYNIGGGSNPSFSIDGKVKRKRNEATIFTYFGDETKGVFRINQGNLFGSTALWIALEKNWILSSKFITSDQPEEFDIRGFDDGTKQWQNIAICSRVWLDNEQCMNVEAGGDELALSLYDPTWFVYEADNQDPDSNPSKETLEFQEKF